MYISKIITGLSIAAFSIIAVNTTLHATDTKEKKHEVIVIKQHTDDGALSTLEFDSDVNGDFLHPLRDGESKSVTSKDGELITFSRSGDELHLVSNGETIVMPYLHEMQANGNGKIKILKMGEGEESGMDIDIEMQIPEGLTISSSRDLDQATQDTIRIALANAGIQDEIHFSKGSRVISKSIILSDDGELIEHAGDAGNTEIEEFISADGKQIKIVKKRVISEGK